MRMIRIACVVFLMSAASGAVVRVSAAATVVIHPPIDDSMLLNPGKGYVQYYGANSTITRDYIDIGYNRVCWSEVEPQGGQFNWRPIEQAIRGFGKYDKKVGVGVMNVSTGIGKQYVTPKWVFEAGAVPLEVPDSSSPTGKQIIPASWEDPVFLSKMKAFIVAFGKQYDGNSNLAFIDIRDYGNWGEGHVGMLGHDSRIILTPPENLRQNYLQPYFSAFPRTQLIVVWGSHAYDKIYDWAIQQGAGIRRDGILSEWSKDGSECLRANGHAPAIFEYCDGYETTKKKGYWSTNLLMKYVEAGKPSYLQWDARIFEENREFCLQLGNRIGYHFILQQAKIPTAISPNAPCSIEWQWLNDGVAPLYEPCHVAIALLDAKDQVVQQQWLTDSQPRNWKPDENTIETVSANFSAVPSGFYKLAVGLFEDRQEVSPAYRLGIQGRTASGWYVLCARLEYQP